MGRPKKIRMDKKPFEVGDRLWIETIQHFPELTFEKKKRTIKEVEVIDANTASAYAVPVEKMDEENPNFDIFGTLKYRINQHTHEVRYRTSLMESYKIWASKEAFEKHLELNEEKTKLRTEAIERIRKMSYEELKEFTGREVHEE